MRAVQVSAWGEAPKFSADLPTPTPSDNSVQIKVIASGQHQLVRSQATGTHYSVKEASLPFIPGADGIGLTVEDNKLVYFASTNTGGAMAEVINVPKASVFPVDLPASITTDEQKHKIAIQLAALLNPAMSSWMAFKTRLSNPEALGKGFTLLILGATSASGRLAISLARRLGATKIIGVARNSDTLSKVAGLDQTIVLQDPPSKTDFAAELMDKETGRPQHIDIVIDYIYNEAALQIFNALPSTPRYSEDFGTEYVQIGAMSAPDMVLPAALLRSKNITIRGAGPGAWGLRSMSKVMGQLVLSLVDASIAGELDGVDIVERKLEDADKEWATKTSGRTVFVV